MKLYTIGYEGQSLVSFQTLLKEYQIQRVVDVRELPLSHKPGFSKSRLRDFLHTIGIEYIHIAALGCPKSIRRDFRATNDLVSYRDRFQEYLAAREAELLDLEKMAREETCCLLCFEADHFRCHRSFIAARLAEMSRGGLEVAPIIPGQTGEAG